MYPDLGKEARDILGKGYHFGLVKLDVKSKTKTGLDLTSGGSSNQESGKVSGSLEGKYRLWDYNSDLVCKWDTSNLFTSTLEIQDVMVTGLKVILETTANPASNLKDGKVTAEYCNDALSLSGDVDLNLSGPLINGSAVVSHGPWLAGYQMSYDTAKSKLTKNNFGLGLKTEDYILHGNMNDGQIFGGSLYKQLNAQLQLGATLGYRASANTTTVGLGAKYEVDRETSLRAKLNNSRQLGLSYSQLIRPGIRLCLSSLIDGMNLNQGGHKIGLALELEA